MTVSVAVMAHPKRADMVEDLLARLDRPATVVWDQVNDRHETGLRALLAADESCTHHLVIQDDALPCRSVVAGVEAALAHVPVGHPASFYIGRLRPFRKLIDDAVRQADGASWLRMPGPYWGPAIAVPTVDVPALAEWWHGGGSRVQNYDRRIARFYQARGLDCFYSWPSLVDHRGVESLSGHGSGALRRAHRSLAPKGDPLAVDWSGPVVEVRGSERADARRQREARRAQLARG